MAYNPSPYRSGAPRRDNDGGQYTTSPPLDTSGIDLCPAAGQSLNPDLFDGIARRVAKEIHVSDDKCNKPAQIRQFYDELVMWEEKARQSPERFADYLPFIRMLNAKAAYAQGRKHVNRTFVDLITHGLGQVGDPATLHHFKLFFEAFLGFYKAERPSGSVGEPPCN